MIRLIKNWWLNRKIEKEWSEWFKRNPEQVARFKKVMSEVEFPTPEKYREWSVQEICNNLKLNNDKPKVILRDEFVKPRSIKDLKGVKDDR